MSKQPPVVTGSCWRHDYHHREYVCTCDPPKAGDTGREDDSHPYRQERPMSPRWFKAWFVFCALVALGALGLGAWVVIELVTWVTAQ